MNVDGREKVPSERRDLTGETPGKRRKFMKAKKFVVAVLAAILAVGAVFAFTACGDPTEEPPPTTNTKSF